MTISPIYAHSTMFVNDFVKILNDVSAQNDGLKTIHAFFYKHLLTNCSRRIMRNFGPYIESLSLYPLEYPSVDPERRDEKMAELLNRYCLAEHLVYYFCQVGVDGMVHCNFFPHQLDQMILHGISRNGVSHSQI